MRRRQWRTAAVLTALAAGGLAAFALRPSQGATNAPLATRDPAAEVRTQVIRRTIHIIRHEPGARLRGSRPTSGVAVQTHGHARTGASGSHGPGSARGSAAVATRTSGSHGAAGGYAAGHNAPVSTRTSGSHGSSSAAPTVAPVSTRASGSHGSSSAAPTVAPVSTRTSGSHGGSSTGSPRKPVTRSSGGAGHGGDGGDGGDGHNGGDN